MRFPYALILVLSLFFLSCYGEETDEVSPLIYWVELHPEAAKIMDSYNENEAYKVITERTGVQVEFVHPPLYQKREQFKLMIANNEFPDIIGSVDHLGGFPGGYDKAIKTGKIIRLNELIEKFAPNYQSILHKNEEIRRATTSPDGNIFSFNMVIVEKAPSWQGMIIRKDWLDLLSLPIPETIDDWENVLTRFKEDLKVQIPLNIRFDNALFRSQVFIGAWDTAFDWINKEGTALWGPSSDQYKEFLTTFHRWYKKGLLDKEFALRHDNSIEQAIITGKMGASNVYSGWFDTFLHANMDNTRFKLSGTTYPLLKRGATLHLSHFQYPDQQNHTVITTSCDNPEEAVRFLDYAYGKEGSRLLTYGIEGVSYNREDSQIFYSDKIINNKKGIPYNTIQYKYMMNHGPFLVDKGKDRARKLLPPIREAQEMWSRAGHDWMWPHMIYSLDENRVKDRLEESIKDYTLDMTIRFIMGLESLENWDIYINNLESMGLNELVKVQQSALDRYLKN